MAEGRGRLVPTFKFFCLNTLIFETKTLRFLSLLRNSDLKDFGDIFFNAKGRIQNGRKASRFVHFFSSNNALFMLQI